MYSNTVKSRRLKFLRGVKLNIVCVYVPNSILSLNLQRSDWEELPDLNPFLWQSWILGSLWPSRSFFTLGQRRTRITHSAALWSSVIFLSESSSAELPVSCGVVWIHLWSVICVWAAEPCGRAARRDHMYSRGRTYSRYTAQSFLMRFLSGIIQNYYKTVIIRSETTHLITTNSTSWSVNNKTKGN